MRLPRDLSGSDLAQALHKLGYSITRQTGSHLRLTTHEHGEHHLTIPQHTSLRIGTLSAILADVATHFEISRDALLERLFG
jgi:predicted RNA binding protein YcfA (HicA-like mRNA interferase family)